MRIPLIPTVPFYEYSRDNIGVGTFLPNDEDVGNNSFDGIPPPAPDILLSNNFTANAEELPSNFKIMEVQKLSDEQKRHCIVFYQSALTLFAKQANNNVMMNLDQYCAITNACIRLHDGESLTPSLRKMGYSNIHQWSKKCSVMQHPNGNGNDHSSS